MITPSKSYTKYENLYLKYCQKLEQKTLLRKLSSSQKKLQNYIDFSSSDYLCLSQHPTIIKQSKEFLEKFGTTSSGSRLLSGNLPIFEELEQKIAKSKNTEDTIIFNSAYQANSSIISALLNKKICTPLVLADKLIHASIHEGFTIAGIKQLRYRHLDMNHLEDLLKEYKSASEKFIFSETVFSMDGDVLDIKSISFLAQKYNAFLCLDEAHSIGIYGNNGYGISLNEGIAIGSFSKGLGSLGGFASCSKIFKSYLINQSKNFIYSTALPPAIIGANLAAWQLLPNLDKERDSITQNSYYLRKQLRDCGFNIGNSSSHIIPIIIGSEQETLSYAHYLKKSKILVSAIRPPSVPPNTSRLRIVINASHSKSDIDSLVNLLKTYKTKYAHKA
ncbi:MAG: aminotransferase class I/II-fold pyridoxal phosphate-dependent enzyme [Rickettsiales bacterium]|nr:aminotransferase class I/II-fold pyridoxal phosphate-dependent enzyme [Rickettsiales bacterium]